MMTQPSERLVTRSVLYTLVGMVVLGVLLYTLKGILAPVLFAFLLAYAFDPVVTFLSRHRLSRSLSGAICLLLLLVGSVGLVALIIPAIQHEIQQVARDMPIYLEKIQASVIPWIEDSLGIQVPKTLSEALESARLQLPDKAGEIAAPLASLLGSILSSTLSLLASLVYLIMIPLFTFYFLRDYHKIVQWFAELIPYHRREKTVLIFGEMDLVLSGFLRGQLTICGILAGLYCILLSVVGVPAAITIGVVAGLFNLVPYLGTFTGILLSGLFLLLNGAPWESYLFVGFVFAGVSIADGLFLTPRILGKKLGLAPVAVILAVLAFGEVFGFFGVLMAVPVTAIGKVLGRHGLDAYRKSRTYAGKKNNLADSSSKTEPGSNQP